MVTLLVSVGGDLHGVADYGSGSDAPTGGGWNGAGALHGAVTRGSADLVKWLMAQGVKLDGRTSKGITALEMARGSTVGINLQVQPELAAIIEQEMRAKGLPIPDQKSHLYINQLDR